MVSWGVVVSWAVGEGGRENWKGGEVFEVKR